MSITDTIGNAIRDYGLSKDAMRWTPGEVTLPDQPPALTEIENTQAVDNPVDKGSTS